MTKQILSSIGSNLAFIILLGVSTTTLNAQSCKITGQILPGKAYPLQLYAFDLASNKYKFDRNLELTNEGEFSFEVPAAPRLYKLWLNGKGLEIVNDEDEQIRIDINLRSSESPFSIQGSRASNYLLEYYTAVSTLQQKYLEPLEPRMKAALKSKDEREISAIEIEHANNLKLFVSELSTLINSMGSSLAVFAIARTLDFNKYLPFIESLGNKFQTERPSLPYTASLVGMIESAKKIQIGAVPPDFKIATLPDGQISSLGDFRGKVLLIDFWASWCLPCRKENPKFVELFNLYKQKGFEVWGLSTDEKEKPWLKAIQKDNLPWTQSRTIDTDIERVYGVASLPTNFLLNEQGEIIAKNITAEKLEELLAQLLNSVE